jgi:hypothetical protein
MSETRNPASRAAGRASDVFCSAAEQLEATQAQPRIQAGEVRPGAIASPAIVSVCDDLRFAVIVEALALAESYLRSAAEAPWRGDRLTLRTHLQQVRLSAITAARIFKELSREGQEASSA